VIEEKVEEEDPPKSDKKASVVNSDDDHTGLTSRKDLDTIIHRNLQS